MALTTFTVISTSNVFIAVAKQLV